MPPPPAPERGRDPEPDRPPRRRSAWPVRLVRGGLRLGLFLVACWALTLAAIAVFSRREEARKADVIVVLGAAQYNGHPSPVLEARLNHAVDLYRRGIAKTLIMTGGQAPGDTVSEAVVSRRFAVRAGVPRGAILVETSGMTTRESMEAVGRLMHARRMKSAVLVSDPFHMLRLKLLARRQGVTGYTSPTRTSPISRNSSQERKFMLRESIGLPLVLLGLA
ncbi:MAG TPA: YdcF family protein [Longimicrobium sp.]|nr:YdcF family protein [Longimicrobium sp.]